MNYVETGDAYDVWLMVEPYKELGRWNVPVWNEGDQILKGVNRKRQHELFGICEI